MAAETDEQKRAEEEERRTGRDRRRAPVTIDLTAERAKASAAQPAQGATAAAGGEPPTRRWPNFARFAPQNMDRETWVGVGSAAALGGVIALLLLMVLQGIGVMPSPGASAARQAGEQARAAGDALASVERRLNAVATMAEGLPSLRGDVTAIGGRVSATEQGAAAAAGNVQGLRNDLAALRTRLDQAPATASSADLAALTARVARVEAAVAGASAPAGAALPPAAPSADSDDRIAALAARLEAAEAAIARLSTAAPPTAVATANARTVALASLRRAVDAGRPFTAELDVLAAFGADPSAAALKPYAATGLPPREALRADFPKVGDAILTATQSSDDSLFGRLVSGARGLVSIRPTGPVAGTDPPAIVSRMDAAVARGDLAAALRERDALPAAGKDVSADWAAKAAARIAADTLAGEPPAVTGAVTR